jgi:hypothetical protein
LVVLFSLCRNILNLLWHTLDALNLNSAARLQLVAQFQARIRHLKHTFASFGSVDTL